jgi:hypothetical protein
MKSAIGKVISGTFPQQPFEFSPYARGIGEGLSPIDLIV